MFRIWGKIIKNNKLIEQHVAQLDQEDHADKKSIDRCVEEICRAFDIPKPLWFPLHEKDFALYGRAAFKSDAFMEEIHFDSFEIEWLKEDKKEKKR